jgi:hypothetical protein
VDGDGQLMTVLLVGWLTVQSSLNIYVKSDSLPFNGLMSDPCTSLVRYPVNTPFMSFDTSYTPSNIDGWGSNLRPRPF